MLSVVTNICTYVNNTYVCPSTHVHLDANPRMTKSSAFMGKDHASLCHLSSHTALPSPYTKMAISNRTLAIVVISLLIIIEVENMKTKEQQARQKMIREYRRRVLRHRAHFDKALRA